MWSTYGMNISLRKFQTGIGDLVAVSQLPSLADDPAVSPQRARNKLLNHACRYVSVAHCGAESTLYLKGRMS